MSDQLVAETSTWQHPTLTTDKYPCPRWDSNPQSQQVSSLRVNIPEDVYLLQHKWSRTVRQGIMRMLAFCEEILKENPLACQDSVFDLLRSSSGTSCIATSEVMIRWCNCSSRGIAPPPLNCHFLSDVVFFLYVFINVNMSFLLVRTAYLENPTYFNSAFMGNSVLTTVSPGTTHGVMTAFSMISYVRNWFVTKSRPVQENKHQEHQHT